MIAVIRNAKAVLLLALLLVLAPTAYAGGAEPKPQVKIVAFGLFGDQAVFESEAPSRDGMRPPTKSRNRESTRVSSRKPRAGRRRPRTRPREQRSAPRGTTKSESVRVILRPQAEGSPTAQDVPREILRCAQDDTLP